MEETKLISIHALREEGDVHGLEKALSQKISIHALREEGDAIVAEAIKSIKISIHALREEGDSLVIMEGTEMVVFLSTPSARRATTTRPIS